MSILIKKRWAWSAGLLASTLNVALGADYGAPSLLPMPGSTMPASYLQPTPEPIPAQVAPQTSYDAPQYGTAPQATAATNDYNYNGQGCAGGCNGFYSEGVGSGSGGCGAWGSSGSAGAWNSCGCNPWFASTGYLFMGRGSTNKFWTTYDIANNANQLMNTNDANDKKFGHGGEVRIGRWFGCDCENGIEGIYWTLAPFGGSSSFTSAQIGTANGLGTPIDVTNGGVTVTQNAVTTPVGTFFDNSPEHRLSREDHVTNIELNWLNQSMNCGCGLGVTWLAGVRYFRFDEYLEFCSVSSGNTFGSNNGTTEAHFLNRSENDLVGFQIGAKANYDVTCKWGLYLMPKFGIYDNNIHTRNQLMTGNGTYFDINGTPFDLRGQKSVFATLAQVDLGTTYQFADRWRVYAGYRVMGVTGLALSDNQFLPFIADQAGFQEPKGYGSLVLHGGFVGLEHRF